MEHFHRAFLFLMKIIIWNFQSSNFFRIDFLYISIDSEIEKKNRTLHLTMQSIDIVFQMWNFIIHSVHKYMRIS